MANIDSWQKDLKAGHSWFLISGFIFLFMLSGRTLFSRFLAQNYYNKALTDFAKASRLPCDITVEKSLLYQRGLSLLKESSRLNPHSPLSYFGFAEAILEIEKDFLLKRSLDIKGLGSGKEGQGDFYDLAKGKLIEAISREPTNPIYHQRLGAVYDKVSEAANAEQEFRRAVLLDPQNISIRLYLSNYYLSKGKQAEFLNHLNRALKLDQEIYGRTGYEVRNFLEAIGRKDLIKQ